jgi:hypothetical protein
MTEGQALQHRALELHAQPVDDGLQLEALVMRGELEFGELAKDDGFCFCSTPASSSCVSMRSIR